MARQFSIELEGLRKDYGDRTVLAVGELELVSGRTYALIGPNGSGKSTLLKVLAGVIPATAGSIGVSGDATRDTVSVGYMPQKSYVFDFSVLRNVELALSSERLAKDEARERALAALEAVGMRDFADARGSSLSGGEAQRVALARMVARDVDVVMLDEPTASMDIGATLLAEEALAAYRAKTGCLLLVATHAPSQARRIADDAVMLHEGRVVERGPVGRVLDDPCSDEGRSFLSYWHV